MPKATLSQEELKELARLLEKLEPGFLPLEVFINMTRLCVVTAVEFVPLRVIDGEIQVLLIPRPSDDPVWPNMLHTPGTILRPTDDLNLDNVFERLLADEIGVNGGYEILYNTWNFIRSDRGSTITIEHILVLDDQPKNGTFYNTQNLPENIISGQQEYIERAVKFYKEADSKI